MDIKAIHNLAMYLYSILNICFYAFVSIFIVISWLIRSRPEVELSSFLYFLRYFLFFHFISFFWSIRNKVEVEVRWFFLLIFFKVFFLLLISFFQGTISWRAIFAPKYAFLGTYRPCRPAHLAPCWLVVVACGLLYR